VGVRIRGEPTRDTAETFIHKWSDTRGVRPPESKAYAVLNDFEQSISIGVLDAFRNSIEYSIEYSPCLGAAAQKWSRNLRLEVL
jgi:hypothetical protein